jgi:hypothetical protein
MIMKKCLFMQVIAACLLMVRQDLHKYKKWKIENPD